MKTSILSLILLIIASALIGLFIFTNPNDMPVVLLAAPILLIFFFFFGLADLLLRTNQSLARRHVQRRLFSILAGLTMALLAVFQSTGGLVIGDLLIMGLIVTILAVYIARY